MSTGLTYQRWVDAHRAQRQESWRRGSAAYRASRAAERAQAWAARRLAIFERDGWTCHYCRKVLEAPRTGAGGPGGTNGHAQGGSPLLDGPAAPLGPFSVTLDHRIPRAEGAKRWDPTNLLTSCWPCNRAKGKQSYEMFMSQIRPEEEPTWVREPA